MTTGTVQFVWPVQTEDDRIHRTAVEAERLADGTIVCALQTSACTCGVCDPISGTELHSSQITDPELQALLDEILDRLGPR